NSLARYSGHGCDSPNGAVRATLLRNQGSLHVLANGERRTSECEEESKQRDHGLRPKLESRPARHRSSFRRLSHGRFHSMSDGTPMRRRGLTKTHKRVLGAAGSIAVVVLVFVFVLPQI